jgi:hypothetical protein
MKKMFTRPNCNKKETTGRDEPPARPFNGGTMITKTTQYLFLLIAFGLFPLRAHAVEREKLDQMLATAAAAQSNAYIEARQSVLDLGANALPTLSAAAADPKLTWQQQLVARICYERISRAKDIENLRRYEWGKDPNYNPEWEKNIMGPAFKMGKIVVPKFMETGLWYYYVELNWKYTKEYSLSFAASSSLRDAWADWAIKALLQQPERYCLVQGLIERLTNDTLLSQRENLNYYRFLLAKKESDAMPLLVKRSDAFVKRTRPSTLSPLEIQKAIRWELEKNILPFADSRHADLIEKYIAEHPTLAPLKDKVAEIRKRPAPAPRAEPPFRLSQTPVKP